MIVSYSACLRVKGYKAVIPRKAAEYVQFASQVHWSNLKKIYLVVLSLLSLWWHMKSLMAVVEAGGIQFPD